MFVVGCGGDGDESCGPGDAPASGLVADTSPTALEFGDLTGGANNDCPAAGAPSGVISFTIQGAQIDGSGVFTLCIGRPDLLAAGDALALGGDREGAAVRVVDITGAADNCTYSLAEAPPPSGTLSATGMCANGDDPAGFALTIAGRATLNRTCGGQMTPVTIDLSGTAAVRAQ